MPEKPTYEQLEEKVCELEELERELKKVDKLLTDEIQWRRNLVEECRDGIVVLDDKCKVFEANKKFADMLGYSMEETEQLYVWDWDAELTKEQILELAQQVDDEGHHFETRHRCKDGSIIDVELSNNGIVYRGLKLIFCICRDVTKRNQATQEREKLVTELQDALAEIKTLQGILPLCLYCKKIRDDKGYWEKVDVYITKHSQADISHSICPQCLKEHYPDLDMSDT